MGFDSIIALNWDKFKSVVCVMDARTRRHRFDPLDTTPPPAATVRFRSGRRSVS